MTAKMTTGFEFYHQDGWWKISTNNAGGYFGVTSLKTGAFVTFEESEITTIIEENKIKAETSEQFNKQTFNYYCSDYEKTKRSNYQQQVEAEFKTYLMALGYDIRKDSICYDDLGVFAVVENNDVSIKNFSNISRNIDGSIYVRLQSKDFSNINMTNGLLNLIY
jgi:hypothetical protein